MTNMRSLRQFNQLFRKVFVRCLSVFLLTTIIGLLMLLAYNHQMGRIEVGCGSQVADQSVKQRAWTRLCVRGYSRYHMGVTVWWGPVFSIGAVGTAASLVGLLIVARSREKRSLL